MTTGKLKLPIDDAIKFYDDEHKKAVAPSEAQVKVYQANNNSVYGYSESLGKKYPQENWDLFVTKSDHDQKIRELLFYKNIEINDLQSKLDGASAEIEQLKVRNQHLGHDLDMTNGKLIEKTLDYDSSKNRNAEYFDKIQSLEATIGRQALALKRIEDAYSMRQTDIWLNHNMSPQDYLSKEISEALYPEAKGKATDE